MLMSGAITVSSEEGRQTPSQSHLIKDEKSEVGEVDEDVTSDVERLVMEKVEETTEVIHHSLI